jgi:hypothetical protein
MMDGVNLVSAMPRSATVTGTASVDNGPPLPCRLTIEQEVRIQTTNRPRPDSAWEFVDGKGHWHAYGEQHDLPTLEVRTEHQECDGSCAYGRCEGFDVDRSYCRICGEEVVPGIKEGPHTVTRPGVKSWHVEVDGHPGAPDDRVSVRISTATGVQFGIAQVADVQIERFERARATLVGIGPLGKRP